MIRKQDLPYSLRILEDYFDEYLSKRFTIPSQTNEFGEECYEDIEVDQFCLSSKQVEEGRQYWFYQGAYDREREEREKAGIDYYPALENVLKRSEEAITLLEDIHRKHAPKQSIYTEQDAFHAVMILYSKVIRVLRMTLILLRNTVWETTAVWRMITEACLLSEYFTYLENNGKDTTPMQRWYRLNYTPSISDVIRILYEELKDTPLKDMMHEMRRMYYNEGMTLHCTVHDLLEMYISKTEGGRGERMLYPVGFDYTGNNARWQIYRIASEMLPSKIFYCYSVFQTCLLRYLDDEDNANLEAVKNELKGNEYRWKQQ